MGRLHKHPTTRKRRKRDVQMEMISKPQGELGVVFTANTTDGTSEFRYKDGNATVKVVRKWDNTVYTLWVTLTGTPVNAVDAYASMRGGLFASMASAYRSELLASKDGVYKITIGFGDFVRNSIAPTTRNTVTTGKVVAAIRNAEAANMPPEVLALLKGLLK